MIKDSKVGDFFAEFDRRFRNGEKKPLTASVFGAKSGMTVSEYIDSAKERAEAWNYADALQMYVWSHYNCLDFEPSRYGVRLSYDLSDWKKLGEKYPPAFEALINIREEKTSLLLRGKGDKYLFHDVFAINRTFDEHSLSIELYEKLEVIDPALADSCWWIIEATLFHARNLKAILKRSPELLTKPVETMNSFVESLRNFQEAFKLNDKEEITDERKKEFLKLSYDAILEYEVESFVRKVKSLLSLLHEMGDKYNFKRIGKTALELVDSPDIRDLIKERF